MPFAISMQPNSENFTKSRNHYQFRKTKTSSWETSPAVKATLTRHSTPLTTTTTTATMAFLRLKNLRTADWLLAPALLVLLLLLLQARWCVLVCPPCLLVLREHFFGLTFCDQKSSRQIVVVVGTEKKVQPAITDWGCFLLTVLFSRPFVRVFITFFRERAFTSSSSRVFGNGTVDADSCTTRGRFRRGWLSLSQVRRLRSSRRHSSHCWFGKSPRLRHTFVARSLCWFHGFAFFLERFVAAPVFVANLKSTRSPGWAVYRK